MTYQEHHRFWPEIKRLIELWNGSPTFREEVERDFDRISGTFRLSDPGLQLARKLWVDNSFTQTKYSPGEFPELEGFRQRQQELLELRSRIRKSCTPAHRQFRLWRTSQINRCSWQLAPELHDAIIHMPVCFELSLGCSVGCWFCGLGAPRLSDLFEYNVNNRALWRDVLQGCREIIGPAAGYGSLFWATEPFDNRDYEKFCLDFQAILEVFPQTTTALPLQDINRTKEFLDLSEGHGCPVNRFSVSQTEDLGALHEHFSAEELARVELVLQARGSHLKKARAGRLLRAEGANAEAGTISCATGFLVNMVEKSIKLISPWPADSVHPYGYRIYGQANFNTGADFSSALTTMIADRMEFSFTARDRMQLTPGIQYLDSGAGAHFSSPHREIPFEEASGFPELNRLLDEHDAGEIALYHLERHGEDPSRTFMLLNSLLQEGIILRREK